MTRGEPAVLRVDKNGVCYLTLNRPARHNSLVPALLDGLNDELDAMLRSPPRVLVLGGAGPSFSTGGDVRGFLEAPPGERVDFARRLVGALHHAIETLTALPCPVVVGINGPVTGGSLGLVLASDIAVMAHDAFIAPYYAAVGFSPDGGWTALLPERIGPARAAEIQMRNRHVGADEALALGLASEVVDRTRLDSAIEAVVDRLLTMNPASLSATRALIWDEGRRARLKAGLAREYDAFLARIADPGTEAGMIAFLARPRGGASPEVGA